MRPLHALDIRIENACHCFIHSNATVLQSWHNHSAQKTNIQTAYLECVSKEDARAPVSIRVTLATTIWAALLNSNAFLSYSIASRSYDELFT